MMTESGALSDSAQPSANLSVPRFVRRMGRVLTCCFNRNIADIHGPLLPHTSEAEPCASRPYDRGAEQRGLSQTPPRLFLSRLAQHSPFTADTFSPDSLEAEAAHLPRNPRGNLSQPELIARELLENCQQSRLLIANGAYKRDGDFYYIKPQKNGSFFSILCAKNLNQAFVQAGETERQDVLQYFCQYHRETVGDKPCFGDLAFMDFIQEVHRSLKLEQTFSEWEQKGLASQGLMTNKTEPYRLMIEGRLISTPSDRFKLENEPGYLRRNYQAFMFLLDTLAHAPDTPISMTDINHAAAIIGCGHCSRGANYGLRITRLAQSPFFIEMLQNVEITNDSKLPDSQFFQQMAKLLRAPLSKKEGSIATEDTRKRIEQSTSYYQLRLRTDDQNGLYFKVIYRSDDKQKDAQKVLDQYYDKIATATEPLTVFEAAVTACCELQRQHVFSDGNGRLFFFILLPILLYQRGYWLESTLDSPLGRVDREHPRDIAKELLQQRSQHRPVFSEPLDWQAGMTTAEHTRLLVAMGKTEDVAKVLSQQPELLKQTFRPCKSTLLETAVNHNQQKMVEHILIHYPHSVSVEQIKNLVTLTYRHGFDDAMTSMLSEFLQHHYPQA